MHVTDFRDHRQREYRFDPIVAGQRQNLFLMTLRLGQVLRPLSEYVVEVAYGHA